MNTITLTGCRPSPLTGYLKALGVLRLLAEQADPSVRGAWRDGEFVLFTKLTREEVVSFFAKAYSPTPLVAPWNGGSGFYPGTNQDGIKAITGSTLNRLAPYREVIREVQSWEEVQDAFPTSGALRAGLEKASEGLTGKMFQKFTEILENMNAAAGILGARGDLWALSEEAVEAQIKTETQAEQKKAWRNLKKALGKARTACQQLDRQSGKSSLLAYCRSRLPDSCLDWLDALYSMEGEKAVFSPVLGTGGNEGNLDYTNNFMQRVAKMLLGSSPEVCSALLCASLLSEPTAGMIEAPIGQFDPGRAGGFNQGMDIETKGFKINPWDFILTMEGAVMLSGAATRRGPSGGPTRGSSPFIVSFSPVGFTSGQQAEEGRGEVWLPLWPNMASVSELRYMFGEGRATLGSKAARSGLEFSRAVGTLGVDRGITAFQRFVFVPRRGQSYVALPAGRVPVRFSPELELLNELDPLMSNLDSFLRRFDTIPAGLASARRSIDEAVYASALDPSPMAFNVLIRSLGRMESQIARRDRSKEPALSRPLFGLSPHWVSAGDEGSNEVRLAASLASVQGTGKVGPLRANLACVSPSATWQWVTGKGQQNWVGNSLEERLAGVVLQRIMDAERLGAEHPPFEGLLPLRADDVMPFVLGELDRRALEELLWGFTLVDFRKLGLKQIQRQWSTPTQVSLLPRDWRLLKLLHWPGPVRDVRVRSEPRAAMLLKAGRLDDARQVALYRLRVSGLAVHDVPGGVETDPGTTVRLLASLLVPVQAVDKKRLESGILKITNESERKGYAL